MNFDEIKNVCILGFGKEGKETLNFFVKKFPKIRIEIMDKNESIETEYVLRTKDDYLKNLEKYDLIVKSAGIPFCENLKKTKTKITTATQIFFDFLSASNKIIAITGTKGKSTISSIIFNVLKNKYKKVLLLGNIGIPLLSMVDIEDYIIVAELSSYQLDFLFFSPFIAVWNNFFPDHLDYHQGIENYFSAKLNIFKNQKKNQYFVFNEQVKEKIKNLNINAIKKVSKNKIYFETSLIGDHNQENLNLAFEVCKIFNIDQDYFKDSVKNFKPLGHRLEIVDNINNVTFVNDAISTTPESTIVAINSFKKKIGSIILGGLDRGYDFTELAKILTINKIKTVILFPDSGNKIKKEILKYTNYEINFYETESMELAVKFAFKNTEKDKICLLSTASPSYNLFKNFEDKGTQFKYHVGKLENCN